MLGVLGFIGSSEIRDRPKSRREAPESRWKVCLGLEHHRLIFPIR